MHFDGSRGGLETILQKVLSAFMFRNYIQEELPCAACCQQRRPWHPWLCRQLLQVLSADCLPGKLASNPVGGSFLKLRQCQGTRVIRFSTGFCQAGGNSYCLLASRWRCCTYCKKHFVAASLFKMEGGEKKRILNKIQLPLPAALPLPTS